MTLEIAAPALPAIAWPRAGSAGPPETDGDWDSCVL